jgi:CRP-like cAMP-binding protein
MEKVEGINLKSVNIFSTLSDEEREQLATFFHIKKYKAGERIIKQGDDTDDLYVVHEGYLPVSRTDWDKDVYLTMLGPGDYFGEAALFASTKRSANVDAQGDAILIGMSKQSFVEYMNRYPDSVRRILFEMLRQLFLRLQTTSMELQSARKAHQNQGDIDKFFT